MLAIRPQSKYIIGHDDKKKGQMAPLISTFSSTIVDKEVARSYNQLYAVASPDLAPKNGVYRPIRIV